LKMAFGCSRNYITCCVDNAARVAAVIVPMVIESKGMIL
jgi:hypothetical protein